MLNTKSKFSTNLLSTVDQYQVIEFALSFVSSFASHMHKQPIDISDKIAQNNANHGMRADDRNILNTLILVMLFKRCMLVVLMHFKF